MAIFKDRSGDKIAVALNNILYARTITSNLYMGGNTWKEVSLTQLHLMGGDIIELPFESFQDVADCLQ